MVQNSTKYPSFLPVLYIVSNIKSDYYYINMAISWLLSVAIIKYKDKAN